MASMFEKYGGFASVSRIVSTFYDRLLESPQLAGYFEGVDMRNLIDHQTKFIAQVMGGPASYTNEQLQRVHAPHRINQAAFEETAMVLQEALEDHGVEDEDVRAIMNQVAARSSYVVST
ncbi:MAG: group 1 truncated hemoglobin [Alphaproteobacteria bacterium]